MFIFLTRPRPGVIMHRTAHQCRAPGYPATRLPAIPSERTIVVTYVICQPCIGVKDASCVDVCPVDCIHASEEDEQYYIDPDECIDCGACEPACPVTAIFEEGAVPPEWREFVEINAVNAARLTR